MAVGFSTVPTTGRRPNTVEDAAEASWVRRVAEGVNNLLKGKLNVTLDVNLTHDTDSTTIKDARIGAYSAFLFEPLTASGAVALYESPYVLVTSQQSGEATFAHVNDANTDKNLRMIILG